MSPKNYLIIGGSHGIGFELAKRLAVAGHHLTVVSRTTGSLTDALPQAQHVQNDVLEDDLSMENLPATLDGFAYCPGSIHLGSVRSLTPAAMRHDYELNVVGAVKCLQLALPALKAADSASVVLFSSVAAGVGLPLHASVAASKGAIEGLTRALAAELAPHVRVNCIAPSLTDTPLAESLLSNERKRSAMAERHPLKRIGSAQELASTAEYLLSDTAGWITGQILPVDGGLSALRV